jgi:hypothetical protein
MKKMQLLLQASDGRLWKIKEVRRVKCEKMRSRVPILEVNIPCSAEAGTR